MDLEDRGRVDLAHRCLNGYLEITGDYARFTVLPFYLTYRALVRAKVAGIRLRQAGLSSEKREELHNDFESYRNLAERFTRRARPSLIITHGLSGSGKTTGTQSLVEGIGAIRIRSDVERKRLFGLQSHERSQSAAVETIYAPAATERTYTRLGALAETILNAGFSVVVDAAFLKRAQRDAFRRLAERLKVPLLQLSFQATTEILRERVARRQSQQCDASEANLEVLEQQIAGQEVLGEDEHRTVITVDVAALGAAESLAGKVAARLISRSR